MLSSKVPRPWQQKIENLNKLLFPTPRFSFLHASLGVHVYWQVYLNLVLSQTVHPSFDLKVEHGHLFILWCHFHKTAFSFLKTIMQILDLPPWMKMPSPKLQRFYGASHAQTYSIYLHPLEPINLYVLSKIKKKIKKTNKIKTICTLIILTLHIREGKSKCNNKTKSSIVSVLVKYTSSIEFILLHDN